MERDFRLEFRASAPWLNGYNAVLLRLRYRFDSCWGRHPSFNRIFRPLYNSNLSNCLFEIICLYSEFNLKQNPI